MRIKEKMGATPTVILDKGEVRRVYEAAYILRAVGRHTSDEYLPALARSVIDAVEDLAPEWKADPETGDLSRLSKEQIEAAEALKIAGFAVEEKAVDQVSESETCAEVEVKKEPVKRVRRS